MIQAWASLLAAVLLVGAADPFPWLERVLGNVQAGRERGGSARYERRAELDAVAAEIAGEIAARPHAERLQQRQSVTAYLDARGVRHIREATLHLDMGKGYRDWGDKFTRSWRSYEMAWDKVMQPRYDAIGFGAARGDDGWVVFAAVLVDDLSVPTDLRAIEAATIAGINAVREESGLRPLAYHERLSLLAREYSERMVRDGFFSHRSPDGGTLEERASIRGIRYRSIGENLHKSLGHDDPVAAAVTGWMASPSHRENILDGTYTHTGVGAAVSEDGTVHLTQLFMLPTNPE